MASFLLELRVTAASHPNVLRRKLLRDAADSVQSAVDTLNRCPTAEVMRELNAAWARGHRQLALASSDYRGGGGGGARKRAVA